MTWRLVTPKRGCESTASCTLSQIWFQNRRAKLQRSVRENDLQATLASLMVSSRVAGQARCEQEVQAHLDLKGAEQLTSFAKKEPSLEVPTPSGGHDPTWRS